MKHNYGQNLQAIRQEINQRFSQIISMIQHNPQLTKINPEILMKGNFG